MVRHSKILYLFLCLLVLVAMVTNCVRPAATPMPTSPPAINTAPTPTPTPTPYSHAFTPCAQETTFSIGAGESLPPGYRIEVIYPSRLACPAGIALTPSGDFLIVENHTNDIIKVTPDGKISIIASGIGATAVAINQQGEVFVGGNGGIWKLSPEGKPAKFSKVGVSKITFGPDGYLGNYPLTTSRFSAILESIR